jgi:hypothetical protein
MQSCLGLNSDIYLSLKTAKNIHILKANVKTMTTRGRTVTYSKLNAIPATHFLNNNEKMKFTQHYIPLCDIMTLHRMQHKNSPDLKSCDISIGMDP